MNDSQLEHQMAVGEIAHTVSDGGPSSPIVAGSQDSGGESDEPIGKRLLPQVVDRIAERDPEKVFTSSPKTTDIEDGFYDVTYAEFARLVNYMSWWIHNTIGRGENFETLGYIGTTDFRYIVVFLAAIKCGYKLFVPSTRNSLDGNLSLLNELQCAKFMHSSEMTTKSEELKRHKPDLQLYSIPSHRAMLAEPTTHYNYGKSYEEAEFDDIFICHTSGTTGNPKPIVVNNGHFTTYDNLRKMPKVEGRDNLDYSTLQLDQGYKYYSPFPPFHMGGMLTTGVLPMFVFLLLRCRPLRPVLIVLHMAISWYETPVIVGIPDKPPSGELLAQIIRLQPKLKALMTPPTPLEQLLADPHGLKLAGKLDFILYGGGPLSPPVGERLRQVTKLAQLVGSTELGMVPLLFPDQETWNWFEWHPYYKLEMQHVEDNIYEMVVPYDPDYEWICRVNQVPPKQEWRTRDLFEKHPEKPGLWRFYGRRDDTLVLSNGEKFNPVGMEGIISGHPLVRGAVIVGTGRFQAALLLELIPGLTAETVAEYRLREEHHTNGQAGESGNRHRAEESPSKTQPPEVNGHAAKDLGELIVDAVWPSIEHANRVGPQHGRVFRSKIHIGTPDKPFARSGKGTVIRSLTEKLYTAEIDNLYTGGGIIEKISRLPNPCSFTDVQAFIRKTVRILTQIPELPDDQDLFTIGIDSLQTLEIVNAVRSGLELYPARRNLVTIKAVYEHPSVTKLSLWLNDIVTSGGELERADPDELRVQAMSRMVAKYTDNLPLQGRSKRRKTALRKRPQSETICVALTGSTGTLGTNMLQTLLQDPQVSTVYCLNRAADARLRHAKALEERGYPQLLNNEKAVFLTARFGDPQFGQTEPGFSDMLNEVDVIIHNAWKVNFHHSLESFEAEHVRGTWEMIEWCRRTSASILFVSSISSISFYANCFPEAEFVPETPLTDYRTAKNIGYGESKHVAERLLQTARDRCGALTCNLRVGQVAGPTAANGGVWNRHEYIPALVRTSLELGCMPEMFQDIDWTPVDTMAQIIIDLAHEIHRGELPQAFHLTNPNMVPWSDFVKTTQEFYADRRQIKAIPLSRWVEMLRKADQTNPRLPAAKILEFFEDADLATRDQARDGASGKPEQLRQWLDTTNGVHASKTMAKLGPMSKDLFKTWLEQWDF